MGLKDERIRDNKEAIEALPEKIEGVEMLLPDGSSDMIDLVKGESKSGKSSFYTVIHEEFEEGQIKMFIPQMGLAGFVPTVDEIKELFKGESVTCNSLVSNAGKNYSMSFSFNPYEKDSGSDGKQMPFLGLWEKEFANKK